MATWNAGLAIGIPLIDIQHQQLLDQLDALANALKAGKGEYELKSIIKFLEMYVNQHFSYEEQCMHRYQCPVARINQDAHQIFVDRMQLICQEIERSGATLALANQVQQELTNWFVIHIQMIDTKLKSSISG